MLATRMRMATLLGKRLFPPSNNVEEYDTVRGSTEIYASYFRCYANSENGANAGVGTVNLINLTNFNKLSVDIENVGLDSDNNATYIQVRDAKGGRTAGNQTINHEILRDFSRQIVELDVSAVNGEWYIVVWARDSWAAAERESDVRVYNIWLE